MGIYEMNIVADSQSYLENKRHKLQFNVQIS